MKVKRFLVESKDIERDSFIWNMAGSMLMAFQSVIMLMILTRCLGLKEAGIFTIAYANSNLFLTIGKYGMRNFQVSDVKDQFSFREYKSSRIITTVLMLAVSLVYVIYISNKNQYDIGKSLVIIWMCTFKSVDSLEDVYHGYYQQKGHLEIAGKVLTIRLFFTIVVFAAGLILFQDLLIALVISTIFTLFLFVILTKWSYRGIKISEKQRIECLKIKELLKICFPLFLGNFLAFYIGNAPKYAIDSILNDELQACYGFIAMPVFVIGLLNNFIFNPMIHKMSIIWNEKNINNFIRLFWIQVSIIFGITAVCIIGAYAIGIPVLSFLYNTNLAPYKVELIILLLGGGFLALSGFLMTMITIIRFQITLVAGYLFVAILAYLGSPVFVGRYSMRGATVLYLMLMVILCISFSAIFAYGLGKKGKELICIESNLDSQYKETSKNE